MSEKIAGEILAIVLLCGAYVWEINDDRLGENEKDKGRDVYIRIGIAFVTAVVASLITRSHTVLSSLVLAGAIHFFCFDYTIAAVLISKKIIVGNPFNYTGSRSKVDNWQLWRRRTAWQKFLIRLAVLIVAILLYAKW